MDTGYFGLKPGRGLLNGVLVGSLIPHISYGVVLGLLLERYMSQSGTVFGLLRCVAADSRERPAGVAERVGRG